MGSKTFKVEVLVIQVTASKFCLSIDQGLFLLIHVDLFQMFAGDGASQLHIFLRLKLWMSLRVLPLLLLQDE